MYRPGNILVTGGAGFIASHVAVHLTKAYPDSKIVSALRANDAQRGR